MELPLNEMRKTWKRRVWERRKNFSFEHVAFVINMQMDMLGRHLDIRAWSSRDGNSAFVYAHFRTLQNKTLTCVLLGDQDILFAAENCTCCRAATLLVNYCWGSDPKHMVIDYTYSMALVILPGRANRCLSKVPSFMNDGSRAFSSLPPFDGYSWC